MHIAGFGGGPAGTCRERPTRSRSVRYCRNWSPRRPVRGGRSGPRRGPVSASAGRRRRRPFPPPEQERRPSVPPSALRKFNVTQSRAEPTVKLVIAALPRKPRQLWEITLAWRLDFGNMDRQYPPLLRNWADQSGENQENVSTSEFACGRHGLHPRMGDGAGIG